MNRFGLISVFIVSALALGGCEGTRSVFGGKSAPDEFVVYSRAPLSLPPSYGLKPPAPGTDRPQTIQPRTTAREALLGGNASKASGGDQDLKTPGIRALVARAGGFDADPNIRVSVNRETSILANKDDRFTNKLLFWQTRSEPGVTLDAVKETKRIRDAKEAGRPIADQPQPTISRSRITKPKSKSLWGSWFN